MQALGPIQIMALALEPLGVQLCGWWLLEPGKEGRCQASVCPQCVLEGTLGRTVPSCVPVPTTGPATPSTAPVSVSLGGSARTAHRVSCCPRKCSCHGASTHRAELSWRREHPPETHVCIGVTSVCMMCVPGLQHVCGGDRPAL